MSCTVRNALWRMPAVKNSLACTVSLKFDVPMPDTCIATFQRAASVYCLLQRAQESAAPSYSIRSLPITAQAQ